MQHKTSIWLDQFGRQKRKLRISVTDRCNFKCVYCMPEHPEWMHKQDLLSFEELYYFCEFMVQRGIEHIRLTGGEPLMRQGIVHFVARLQDLKKLGLKRVSMTSNAHYLKKYAVALKQAGLDDINISLDSLDAQQFYDLTKKHLAPVLEGIQAAMDVGLPVKINTVLIQGVNQDQILPLAHWSIQHQIMLRFIEFMPLDGDAQWTAQHVVTEQQILQQLRQDFEVQIPVQQGAEPARHYLINQHPIGVISTISNSFCGTCDRLRLTAKGEFYNCLFAEQGLDLKAQIQALALQKNANSAKLQQHLSDYIWQKKQGFHAIEQQRLQRQSSSSASTQSVASRKISMHMIGG